MCGRTRKSWVNVDTGQVSDACEILSIGTFVALMVCMKPSKKLSASQKVAMSHARALGYIGVHGAAMLGCRNITASTVSSLVRAGFLCQSSDPKVDGWALVPYDHPSAINPFWA